MNDTEKLIHDLRLLGKYSKLEPNWLVVAADKIEELSKMPNKLTDSEIVKAKELIKKLEEAYNAYYDTSKGMPYDIDATLRETAICLENSLNEINRLQAENERLKKLNLERKTCTFCKHKEKNLIKSLVICAKVMTDMKNL